MFQFSLQHLDYSVRTVNFANRSSFLLTTLLALKHQHVRERIVELTEVIDVIELSSYFTLEDWYQQAENY